MTFLDLPAGRRWSAPASPRPGRSTPTRPELETNKLARYLVVRRARGSPTGIWLMVDEAHVTTSRWLPLEPRRIVERLLTAALDLSIRARGPEATLEVRLQTCPHAGSTRSTAFGRSGFGPPATTATITRTVIMTTEPLLSPGMQIASRARRRSSPRLPDPERPDPPCPRSARDGREPLLLAIESSATRRGCARGGWAPESWPQAGPAKMRCTPRPAGSCPSSLRAHTCAGSCPAERGPRDRGA